MGLFRKYSDSDIIDGIRKQDNRILSFLYDSWFGMVRDYLRKNGGTDDDVYEVFQETIVMFYRKITGESFQVSGDLKGYFFGMTRIVWTKLLQHRSRLEPMVSEPADTGDDDLVRRGIMERIVMRSFAMLKEDCQMVLNLVSEGYNYADIAEKMGLASEAYARRKKYLCKEALMEIIKTDPEYQDLGPL